MICESVLDCTGLLIGCWGVVMVAGILFIIYSDLSFRLLHLVVLGCCDLLG